MWIEPRLFRGVVIIPYTGNCGDSARMVGMLNVAALPGNLYIAEDVGFPQSNSVTFILIKQARRDVCFCILMI